MKKVEPRKDDFELRREHLKNLSDEQLKQLFWQLTDKVVKPLVDVAKKNTSPSIERSVLLRMGFSSIEAKGIVEVIVNEDLLGYGAGNIVYINSKNKNISIREAGLDLLNNFDWEAMRNHLEVY